jgi:hypothetical protein
MNRDCHDLNSKKINCIQSTISTEAGGPGNTNLDRFIAPMVTGGKDSRPTPNLRSNVTEQNVTEQSVATGQHDIHSRHDLLARGGILGMGPLGCSLLARVLNRFDTGRRRMLGQTANLCYRSTTLFRLPAMGGRNIMMQKVTATRRGLHGQAV